MVVDVPLSAVGNPKPGSYLLSPTGQTFELVGTPQTGGLLEPVDSGGPDNDYQVGQVCSVGTVTGVTGVTGVIVGRGVAAAHGLIQLPNTTAAAPTSAAGGSAILLLITAGAARRRRRRRRS